MDIRTALTRFVADRVAISREQSYVVADEPLFSGLLDSVDMLRLVMFIEEEFGIEVQDHEIVPENFRTIERIIEYVQQKQALPR